MFKQVSLYKRKAGISAEAFRAYYEETHVRTRLSSMTLPGLRRYMRRYLTAIPDPVTGKALDLGYDMARNGLMSKIETDLAHYYREQAAISLAAGEKGS